jgi:hypothetical protein
MVVDHETLLVVASFAGGLVLTKAVLEPIAQVVGQLLLPRGVAQVLVLMDRLIPQLLEEGVGREEAERRIRQGAIDLTGDQRWGRTRLHWLWQKHEAGIMLERNRPEA